MNRKYIKVLTFVFAAGLCVCIVWFLSEPVDSEVTSITFSDSGIIAGYKGWTQVNPEPQIVPSRIAMQCAAPTALQQSMEDQNPHRDKFVRVYVNEIGKVAMMEQKRPRFPQGSVIVKEKLATKESSSPELLTVMRKRESGYDPEKGDWEYFVFDGTGQVVEASGKLEKCQACHLREQETDYVSRSYLPREIWQKLK